MRCDVLIVGGGGSGVLAGLEASKQGDLRVILASKGPIGQSGLTPTANGGTHTSTSAEEMFDEAIAAGELLGDQNLVWRMASGIRGDLDRLAELGIAVLPLSETSVYLSPVDALKKLRKRLMDRPNVELLEDVLVTRLALSGDRIAGATALNLRTGSFFVIEATSVVIATGGLTGELYPHSSNNPFGLSTRSSGTGHVMAFLAGAELVDMEMIQFVPLPANPRALHLRYFPEFWSSPYLNDDGEVIVADPSSYLDGSYAYRFARKLFNEIATGKGPVYIDRRGLEEPLPVSEIKAWRRRRKLVEVVGIDPRDHRIEIVLGSHFGMGGVRANEKTETRVPGLYAAGEVMGGVHGAFRLSGNSFAQMIVFGLEAGKQAAEGARRRLKDRCFPLEAAEREKERIFGFLAPKRRPVGVRCLKNELQQVMQEHAFIVRQEAGLKEGLERIREIKKDVSRIGVPGGRRFNLEWIDSIELALMMEAAEIIVRSALVREESRGSHYRADFPQRDDDRWLRHTRAKWEEGQIKIAPAPVVCERSEPGVAR